MLIVCYSGVAENHNSSNQSGTKRSYHVPPRFRNRIFQPHPPINPPNPIYYQEQQPLPPQQQQPQQQQVPRSPTEEPLGKRDIGGAQKKLPNFFKTNGASPLERADANPPTAGQWVRGNVIRSKGVQQLATGAFHFFHISKKIWLYFRNTNT